MYKEFHKHFTQFFGKDSGLDRREGYANFLADSSHLSRRDAESCEEQITAVEVEGVLSEYGRNKSLKLDGPL